MIAIARRNRNNTRQNNRGRTWSNAQKAELARLIERGFTRRQIAEKLGRTHDGIVAACKRFGLTRDAPGTPPRNQWELAARDNGQAPDEDPRLPAAEATIMPRGSIERVLVYAARFAAGQELWHPDDAEYGVRRADLEVA